MVVNSLTSRRTGDSAVVLLVSAGVFMANLDLFVVNVALPSIGRALGSASIGSLSWVLTVYAAIYAGFLVPLGRWADRSGRRRGYIAGLLVFTVASAGAAAAPSVGVLVAARAVQAFGAALVVPTSLALLLSAVPPAGRVRAIGSWAAASAVAAAAGPVLGGLLVELDWRWVFLVNVPMGLAAAAASARVLPEARVTGDRPLDVPGAVLVTVATTALALWLVQGGALGWFSTATAATALAAVGAAALFGLRTVRHDAPLIEAALLRRGRFRAANLASLVFYAVFAAMLLSLVLFLSGRWAYSPLRAGAGIAPGPLVVFVVARWLTPRLLAARGPAATGVLGAVCFAAGFTLWACSWGSAPAYAGEVLPGLLLTGLGVGLVLPATVVAGSTALPAERFATGSAVLTMARQLGAVAGTAGLVALLGPSPRVQDFRASLAVLAVLALVVALPSGRMK